jgi:molecular chaperone GrpE
MQEDLKQDVSGSTGDPNDPGAAGKAGPNSDDAAAKAAGAASGAGDKDESDQANEVGSQDDEDEQESFVQKLAALQDKYLRLMAEFDNYKRRSAKEYEKLIESANERLMVDIIEIRETFVRALEIKGSQKDFDTFQEGMKLIFTKMDDILRRHGLQTFAESGEPFDPLIHDAMLQMPHPEIPQNHISQIYEKGYRLKNKVIKHAKVVVSKGAPQNHAQDQKDTTGKTGGDESPAAE